MTLLQADAGLYPDVPGGQVRLSPLAGPELGALAAEVSTSPAPRSPSTWTAPARPRSPASSTP